jgi:CheY-like chemotaxis protein
MRLLLVEDNFPDVLLVREALKRVSIPIELSAVPTGAQALAFLRHQPPYAAAATPDLVLLDLNLPQKNGYEVLAELQQDPTLKCMAVVMLTSSSEQKDINQCYELGANAYLVKPMELEPFLSLVKNTVMFWDTCQFRTLKD